MGLKEFYQFYTIGNSGKFSLHSNRISLIIRLIFLPSITIRKKLDPSYKTDLGFGDVLEVKTYLRAELYKID